MCWRREYEGAVRAIIAEEQGTTVITLRGDQISGSLSLPQPGETLQPGTVVRIIVESAG